MTAPATSNVTAMIAAATEGGTKPLLELTYTLRWPVELKTASGDVVDTVASVTLKRPRGVQMKAIDNGKGEMSKIMSLIAACGSLPTSTVDQMDGEDIVALGEVIAGFLGASLLTGVK